MLSLTLLLYLINLLFLDTMLHHLSIPASAMLTPKTHIP